MLSRSCAHFPVDLGALNGNYALWGKTEPFVIVTTKDWAQLGWPVELYTHPVIAGFPERLQCFGQATNERVKYFEHQTKKVYKSFHQEFQKSLCHFELMIYQWNAQRWFPEKGKVHHNASLIVCQSHSRRVCQITVFPLTSQNEPMLRGEITCIVEQIRKEKMFV